jgi:hypothetical protein
MGFTVTSSGRRNAMVAMLVLAMSGAIIRFWAPKPSTLRDVGSLLLVLWLPAVGNLIAYFVRKLPRRAPPVTDFAADAVFTPQLRVRLQAADLPANFWAAMDPAGRRCTVLVGRHGFTARMADPLADTLKAGTLPAVELELLHPAVALPRLAAGTHFHLLAGTTAIATGQVLQDGVRPPSRAP